MANPTEIRRNAASTKLDRLVTWRERDNVRSSRGRNVKTFTDREIWAQRFDSESVYSLECVFHVKLPPVPTQSCHPVQAKVATCSNQSCHPSERSDAERLETGCG